MTKSHFAWKKFYEKHSSVILGVYIPIILCLGFIFVYLLDAKVLNKTAKPEVQQTATKTVNGIVPETSRNASKENSTATDSKPTGTTNSPTSSQDAINKSKQDEAYYKNQASEAQAKLAESQRCGAITSTAYSIYSTEMTNARNRLFNSQEPVARKSRDSGIISLAEYDNLMRQYYAEYNATKTAIFNRYTNTITSQNCAPSITTPPTNIQYNF